MIKLIERRPPEVLPFERVEEDVRRHYRPVRALELAGERAAELAETAERDGIEAALENLNAELELEEDAAIQVQRSEVFTRSAFRTDPITGSGRAMVQRAFDLPADRWGHHVGSDAAFLLKPEYPRDVEAMREDMREEFRATAPEMRAGYLTYRRRDELGRWMRALLDAAQPDRGRFEALTRGDEEDESPAPPPPL